MKKSDIRIGGKYTDGKGNVREVIDMGPQYILYVGQACTECLRYKLIAKRRGPDLLNSENNSTIRSFASWAKRQIIPVVD